MAANVHISRTWSPRLAVIAWSVKADDSGVATEENPDPPMLGEIGSPAIGAGAMGLCRLPGSRPAYNSTSAARSRSDGASPEPFRRQLLALEPVAPGGGLQDLAETVLGNWIVAKVAVRDVVEQLIQNWRFDDWKEASLLVDGDKLALHWSARVTFIPNGKSAITEVVDLITFRDG